MEIGEAIAVAVMTTPKEDCWFCKEERKADDPKNDLDEDPDSKGKPENQLQNDSSKLGQALGHRPSWSIVVPKMTEPVGVVPAAHHLVPGNASLKKVTKLLKYMKAGEKVSGDIGYDVNSRQNGVWLPGSYGVTEKSALQQKWSAYEYQDLYAVEAMKRARAQFHDSHPTYSEKVKKTLSCIADRIIANHPVKCPGCGKTL
ncbi:MAG: AHH domain-containing protein, partial [Gemmatimonadales bacterium]